MTLTTCPSWSLQLLNGKWPACVELSPGLTWSSRVLSEVPAQFQHDVSPLERQVSPPELAAPAYRSPYHGYFDQTPNNIALNQYSSAPPNQSQPRVDRYGTASTAAPQWEQPHFSPFPAIRNLAPNIPPTDEDREATLEAAREAVLASNDPEVQLTWAQDALLYVDVSIQNEQRVSTTQPARSRTPRIEHMLREDAMKVVDFLAEQHHPEAEFLRGTWLEFGKFGQRTDKKEAFHCYTRAADKGYARAYYRIGMQFESSNDALKAIKYYQRGSDTGDAACCYRLGMMALLGQHGQQQDYERGMNLIYSASQMADEGAPQGAYVLGMLQARQLPQVNVPERFLALDIPAAKVNIEKAAFLGFAKAQVRMGSAYELSELNCEFNPALSLHYNALAARQGEPEAEMAISKWFLCGHKGLFEMSEEVAFTYAQRAAVGGMATAQFAMGYFYEVGIYVPVNFKEAKEWYARAATSGNQDATSRIDSISRSKTLSRKDHERVAISRIRQNHGRQPVLAPVAEISSPTLDMPDPSRLNINTNNENRPPPAAPYPTNGSPLRPNLNVPPGNYLPDRPNSAFGINPNLRTDGAASYGPRYDSIAPVNRGGFQPRGRPYPQRGAATTEYGRGYGPQAPANPTQSYGPVGRGQPLLQTPPSLPPKIRPVEQQPPPRPPTADIGYSAPVQVGNDGRRRWESPYLSRPQGPGAQTAGKRVPVPSAENRFYANRPEQASAPPEMKIRPANITPSRPPTTATPPVPTKPSKVSASTKLSATPDNSPQTFAEMGVPPGKRDSECVSTVL